ncbi:MAG TPA: hypothetical protein VN605_15005 [Thermoanaerobaculia bacterium]|nr:hypothetical protein [Thermoanaerobaculia bacterium]
MTQTTSRRSPAVTTAMNLAAIAIGWVISFALVRLGYQTGNVLVWTNIGQTAGLVAGVLIAWRLRAVIAAYVLSAFLALSVPTVAMLLIVGRPVVQGRAMQFALLGTAALGLCFGTILNARRELQHS